jgi:hypothetical protein
MAISVGPSVMRRNCSDAGYFAAPRKASAGWLGSHGHGSP